MGIGLSTVNTGEGAGASGGSVQQYVVGSTAMGATSTGVVFVGIQSTTARALTLTVTGGISYVATIATLLGTVAVSGNTVPTYAASGTNMGDSAVGVMFLGLQSGATTGRPFLVTTTGAAITEINGTVGISGTPTFIQVNYSSLWNAYVVATTSAAAGVIIKTSGAHTLYVTDLVVAATGPNDVSILSETTAGGPVAYLATKGGFVYNARTPFVCNTAQSLRVVLASSGSVSVFAAGYTVT